MMALIPAASVAAISLMGVFARQNRKEGWVKTRRTLIDGLRQAKLDLMTIPEPAATHSAVAYAGLPIDPTEFAGQLNRLQTSLDRANQPVFEAAPALAATNAAQSKVLVG
ncbi:MAG TPA: hypothetical protein VG345_05440 [Bryobacteraceae bacterium]|jgi:hypothetical protein|nr:hypothetical protein [Bryobacteraceae bacterium]